MVCIGEVPHLMLTRFDADLMRLDFVKRNGNSRDACVQTNGDFHVFPQRRYRRAGRKNVGELRAASGLGISQQRKEPNEARQKINRTSSVFCHTG